MNLSFKSKIDTWLLLVLLTAVAAFVLGGAHLFARVRGGAMEGLELLGAALILLCTLGAGFLLWLLVGTRYTLTDTHLEIRSGPFRRSIRLDEIEQVAPAREGGSPTAPALSLDRLSIRYAGQSTLISPEHRDAFVRHLEARRNSDG